MARKSFVVIMKLSVAATDLLWTLLSPRDSERSIPPRCWWRLAVRTYEQARKHEVWVFLTREGMSICMELLLRCTFFSSLAVLAVKKKRIPQKNGVDTKLSTQRRSACLWNAYVLLFDTDILNASMSCHVESETKRSRNWRTIQLETRKKNDLKSVQHEARSDTCPTRVAEEGKVLKVDSLDDRWTFIDVYRYMLWLLLLHTSKFHLRWQRVFSRDHVHGIYHPYGITKTLQKEKNTACRTLRQQQRSSLVFPAGRDANERLIKWKNKQTKNIQQWTSTILFELPGWCAQHNR